MRTANGPSLKSEDTRPIQIAPRGHPRWRGNLNGERGPGIPLSIEQDRTLPRGGALAVRRHPNVESVRGGLPVPRHPNVESSGRILRMPSSSRTTPKWPPSDPFRRGHDWPATKPPTKDPLAAEQVRVFPRKRSEAATLTRQPRGERELIRNGKLRNANRKLPESQIRRHPSDPNRCSIPPSMEGTAGWKAWPRNTPRYSAGQPRHPGGALPVPRHPNVLLTTS
jgi:hypothetical protein